MLNNLILDKFKSKIISLEKNKCWVWFGDKDKYGYGRFYYNKVKTRLAHRISYLHYNNISEDSIKDLNVCHHCDNPPCVNPEHLFLGSQLDNVKDMIAKGRANYVGVKGEDSVSSVLREYEVLEIFDMLNKSELSQKEIANIYGVTDMTISNIERGETWKHLNLVTKRSYKPKNILEKFTVNCNYCKNNFKSIDIKRKYCSQSCSSKSRIKADWDSIDIESEVKTKSNVKIASDLGVSETSVRKRLKKLGLKR